MQGRWEARIGQLVGKRYRYLGLYDTENEVRGTVIDSEGAGRLGPTCESHRARKGSDDLWLLAGPAC